MKYLKLIRIQQWAKNMFIFLPLFFSGNLFNTDLFIKSLIGFFIFSFVASSIYIVNDYVDIESDKKHPEKKNRPLASGAIDKKSALFFLCLLIIITILINYLWGNYEVGIIVTAYFIMNIAYSFKLKHIAIFDVTIIAIGFLLRVFVGGSMTGINVTDWTILLTFTLALVLALGKRRGELVNSELEGTTRKSLNGYNNEFLNIALTISCTMVMISYLMYVFSPEVLERMHHYVIYTFIFVFVAVLRYLQQTFVYNKTESPTKLIYKDLFLQVLLVLWGVSYLLLIYFK